MPIGQPVSMGGRALYIACRKLGFKAGQRRVAEAVDVSDFAIRRKLKERGG